MAAVEAHGPHRRGRPAGWRTLALALLLAAVPLPRLAAAAHDPVGAGAGMGTRVPLMLETGVRVATPGTAAGTVRQAALPSRPPHLGSACPAASARAAEIATRHFAGVRLVSVGRLQLEGG